MLFANYFLIAFGLLFSSINGQSNNIKCDDNEMAYEGDNNVADEWVCDCKPGYIYSTEFEKCYPVHQRGPCKPGQSIGLADDGFTAICKLNICETLKKVIYKDRCVRLGDRCDKNAPSKTYQINTSTYNVECLELSSKLDNDISKLTTSTIETTTTGGLKVSDGKKTIHHHHHHHKRT